MVTIEKRGNNSYRLIVSCGYDSENKKILKRKTISLPPNLTEKEIERELTVQGDKFEKEVQKGTYLDGNITLNEFSEKWIKDYAEINLKPKTVAHYKKILKRVVIALGHKKLDSIQPTHLMEFYKNLNESKIRLDYKYKFKENIISDMPDLRKKLTAIQINNGTIKNLIRGGNTTKDIAEKICASFDMALPKVFDIVNNEKKLSSVTINHHHKLISTMLNTAVQWQLILSSPADRVKPPTIKRTESNYYDIDEVYQMLELLENEPIKYKTIVYIVIFCGLRLGELANLEWSDINFVNEEITISKQLQYLPEFGVYEMDTTKTESGNRTIAIPPILTGLLQDYKDWQDDEKTKWGDKWVISDKLFTKDNGEPIFPETPSKWFGKFIKRNNLPPLTFHQLRHTNISLLVGEGIDVATVSKRSGHAKEYVNLRFYTHPLKQRDREAVIKLQNLLSKKRD